MKINNDIIIKDDENESVLRVHSEDVTFPLSPEDEDLIKSLYKYVDDSGNEEIAKAENLRPAVGIAAPQVGVHKKMLAIILKDEEGNKTFELALINPKIISHSVRNSYLKAGEGCLSVPGEHPGYAYRHAKIKVKAYNYLTKKDEILELRGYEAIVVQHEIDHLNGILFYDHINPDDPFYEEPGAEVIE